MKVPVDPDKLIVIWECEECNTNYPANLTILNDDGIPYCDECDHRMYLEGCYFIKNDEN